MTKQGQRCEKTWAFASKVLLRLQCRSAAFDARPANLHGGVAVGDAVSGTRGVDLRQGFLDSVLDDALDRVRGTRHEVGKLGPLLGAELAEDPIGQWDGRIGGLSDAKAQAREGVAAQRFQHRLQSVVPAGAAGRSESDAAERQVDVVDDRQQLSGFEGAPGTQLRDGATGAVDVGGGFDEENALDGDLDLGGFEIAVAAARLRSGAPQQLVDDLVTEL